MDLISIEQHHEDGVFAVKVRDHSITTELATEGMEGKDRGPNPTELLVGSLGSCIAIMVNSYCRNHGYTKGEVSVNMTYQLADKPKRIDSIVIDLEIPEDVPENRINAIKKVAGLCPVHSTLEHPPKIDVEIV